MYDLVEASEDVLPCLLSWCCDSGVGGPVFQSMNDDILIPAVGSKLEVCIDYSIVTTILQDITIQALTGLLSTGRSFPRKLHTQQYLTTII